MRALVTGAAGFIGTSLARRLASAGWEVVGVDRAAPRSWPTAGGRFVRADLCCDELERMLDGVDAVFHLAARTGVRSSWGDEFAAYVSSNVHATQRLLEAARRHPVSRFVYASSSSVYGNSTGPSDESSATRPHSPYAVSKLAGEQLCHAYADNFDTPAVILRYFTVYGPGQRPDMAMRRIIHAALTGTTFHMFGDGQQSRDFTYVDDVVGATIAAATADLELGEVVNVSTGAPATLVDVVGRVERITSARVDVRGCAPRSGDVEHTRASGDRAALRLGWSPAVGLDQGLERQVDWQRRSGLCR